MASGKRKLAGIARIVRGSFAERFGVPHERDCAFSAMQIARARA
jgi:hypothetical protein